MDISVKGTSMTRSAWRPVVAKSEIPEVSPRPITTDHAALFHPHICLLSTARLVLIASQNPPPYRPAGRPISMSSGTAYSFSCVFCSPGLVILVPVNSIAAVWKGGGQMWSSMAVVGFGDTKAKT